MANKVGVRGQVVISKENRDLLGIKPGWLAIEYLVDDHLEVYFVPPEHDRSLKASLSSHVKVKIAPGEDWDRAREGAWKTAAESETSGRG